MNILNECAMWLGYFTLGVLVLGMGFLVHDWASSGPKALDELSTLRRRVSRLEQMLEGEDDAT